MSRPPYRAFVHSAVDGEDSGYLRILWRRVNPDGTPSSLETSPMELAEIAGVFASGIICGDLWVLDFFSALRNNGKATLRGDA